ncbi:MAG TPA: LytTR family DNA-binding domain-containing protein [Puia sp.]|uniref:LytR/AlgR family response regulator transcription factor n=1 Tax=Puia sp. TaxID=2045100 RepID=UPI002C3382FD|nr:LytTR family DNA-binding domain-containing protein [Puia sp.]HVU94357.1 LytTR family DNA-binding domain-containing protein [Puia sp.]
MRTTALPPKYFFIRHEGKHLKIKLTDITYIESRKNYSLIRLRNGGRYMALVTLTRIEETLPAKDFCRVHRAFIVSLDWLSSFDRRLAIGEDGAQVPIGDTYARLLEARVLLLNEVRDRRRTSALAPGHTTPRTPGAPSPSTGPNDGNTDCNCL